MAVGKPAWLLGKVSIDTIRSCRQFQRSSCRTCNARSQLVSYPTNILAATACALKEVSSNLSAEMCIGSKNIDDKLVDRFWRHMAHLAAFFNFPLCVDTSAGG